MNLYPQRWLASLLQWRMSFDKTHVASSHHVQHRDSAAAVRCGYCRTVITESDSAMEMAGAHQHVLTNPAGVSFTVLIYRHARCDAAGLPSPEFSWFNGYAWQLALCTQCGSHLGWCYSQVQFPDFYGLIDSQLIVDLC